MFWLVVGSGVWLCLVLVVIVGVFVVWLGGVLVGWYDGYCWIVWVGLVY